MNQITLPHFAVTFLNELLTESSFRTLLDDELPNSIDELDKKLRHIDKDRVDEAIILAIVYSTPKKRDNFCKIFSVITTLYLTQDVQKIAEIEATLIHEFGQEHFPLLPIATRKLDDYLPVNPKISQAIYHEIVDDYDQMETAYRLDNIEELKNWLQNKAMSYFMLKRF